MVRPARIAIALIGGLSLFIGPPARADEPLVRDDKPETKALLGTLAEPVDMPFADGIEFQHVMKHLGRVDGTGKRRFSYYVDPHGLEVQRQTMSSVLKLDTRGKPIKDSLAEIMKQLGLTYMLKDGIVMIMNHPDDPRLERDDYRNPMARASLDRAIDVSAADGLPIGVVLLRIEQACGCPVYLPGSVLPESGRAGGWTVRVGAGAEPAKTVLRKVLDQHGLTYGLFYGVAIVEARR